MTRVPTPTAGDAVRAVAAGACTLLGAGVVALALVASCRHLVGPTDWSTEGLTTWFDRQPVSAAFWIVACFALMVLAYLAIGTTAWIVVTVAGATGRPRLGAAARMAANPLARRTFAAVLGLGMVVSSATPVRASPATRDTAGAVATMRELSDHGGSEPPRPSPSPATTTAPGFDRPLALSWTVEPGDHLWGLTARALSDTWHRAPTDAEIATHLRRVVEANRDRLAVPDEPDLIFPGQVFSIPVPSDR